MKRNLFLSLFFIFPVLSLYAQQDTIFFRVGVNCPDQGTIIISAKTILEGQTYTVAAYTLPSAYQHLQALYNSLVGSNFIIEDGAINEKIRVDWILNELDCTNGGYLPASNGAQLIFNSHYTVSRWVENDWFPVSGDYNFLNSHKAILSLKNSSGFQTFRLAIPIYVYQIAFFFQVEGTFIPTGLTLDIPADTTDVNVFWVIKASHLSTIVGGQKEKLTGIDDGRLNTDIPSFFLLQQNYPNPFNPSTFIGYSVPQRTNVQINVYNILGIKIATLVNDIKEAGNYHVLFNAVQFASGIYIYELKTPRFIQSRKMIYLK